LKVVIDMWVALFLICAPQFGCEEVTEIEVTRHFNQEACEANAKDISIFLAKRFKELGFDAKVGYKCYIDKDTRQTNGS
jgi:hypothetical protein